MDEQAYVARPYGLDDVFKGALTDEATLWMDQPFAEWMQQRNLTLNDINGRQDDLQAASIFPVTESIDDLGILIRWMTTEPTLVEGRELWLKSIKLSADEISAKANLIRLYKQREDFRKQNWQAISRNYERSIFYQLDLEDAATSRKGLLPQELSCNIWI